MDFKNIKDNKKVTTLAMVVCWGVWLSFTILDFVNHGASKWLVYDFAALVFLIWLSYDYYKKYYDKKKK